MNNFFKSIYLVFAFLMITITAFAQQKGGIFNFCAPYGGDVFSLNMHQTENTQDWIIGMNIYSTLYKWDAEKNSPVFDLLESVKKDGDTYTLKLKENIKFHNGRQMTIDDVIWTFNRAMNPDLATSSAWYVRDIKGASAIEKKEAKTISGLERIDKFTMKMTMNPGSNPAYNFFWQETAILPREEVEGKEEHFSSHPVGSGPFKFVKWVKGSEIVLERFDSYYIEGRPYLDKLIFKIMPEAASRDIAFRTKELDATIVGSTQYPVYKRDKSISKNMIEVAEMYTRLVGFNPQYKPFSDKRVRQAINYAIDRELIVEKLLKGKAVPAISFLPTSSPAFDPNLQGYEYNVDKAKNLLKEAGYEDGFSFKCIGTGDEAWGVSVVEAMIPFLKKINVEVIPQELEGATLAEKVEKGEFEAFIWSIESGPDPLNALDVFHSRNGTFASGNIVLFNDSQFDKALDNARNERDLAKRLEYLKEANSIFLDEAPMWFFNYNKAVLAYHPWVHGMKPVAIEMMFQDFTQVWIDNNSPRAKK